MTRLSKLKIIDSLCRTKIYIERVKNLKIIFINYSLMNSNIKVDLKDLMKVLLKPKKTQKSLLKEFTMKHY
jgi:hypothetical protein